MVREVTIDELPKASERATQYGFRERLPSGFDAWFERCVNRSPASRYADAELAYAALVERIGKLQAPPLVQVPPPVQAPDPAPKILPEPSPVLAPTPEPETDSEEAYLAALRVDGNPAPIMKKLGDLYQARGAWKEAATIFQQCAAQLRNPRAKAQALFEAATICHEHLDDEPSYLKLLEEVLAHDRFHLPAARVMADIYLHEKRWQEAQPLLSMLSQRAEPNDREVQNQRFFNLAQAFEGCGDADAAIESYRHITPDSRYSRSLIETDRVDIYYRAAGYALKLQDEGTALANFRNALLLDPAHVPTLRAVADLQSARANWEAVINAKQRLLPSVEIEERIQLRCDIAEIYENKLAQDEQAIQHYVEAQRLAPNLAKISSRLLALRNRSQTGQAYMAAGTDGHDQALTALLQEIRSQPRQATAYKSLFRRYQEMRRFDPAWCVSAALVGLGKSDTEEARFYEQHKPKKLLHAQTNLTHELWAKYVYHPQQDPLVNDLCAAVYPAVCAMKGIDPNIRGLQRSRRRHLASDPSAFGRCRACAG